MNTVGVMHLVDSLEVGGAELMAVNLVNNLPRSQYRPYLCTTRTEGPLRSKIQDDVIFLNLARPSRFNLPALKRLAYFLQINDIRVLHAHGSALFVARVAALASPRIKVIWHAHYGRLASENRSAVAFRVACRNATVIAVSEDLAEWARRRLHVPAERVHFLRNFVMEGSGEPAHDLPGERKLRVVSVANIREEKDHLTLLRAFAQVIQKNPDARLLLVGAESSCVYAAAVRKTVLQLGLTAQVSFLGQRQDVHAVLKACDVGVLSSATEGLPMALLEYGMAGLATVATRSGQCSQVLNNGEAGILVPPRSPQELALALEDLLASPERRAVLGCAFRTYVQRYYSAQAVIDELCHIYERLIPSAQGPRTVVTTQGGIAADERSRHAIEPSGRPSGAATAGKVVQAMPAILMVGNFLSETMGNRGVCEELAPRLRQAGHRVVTTSHRKGRVSRIIDMLSTCWMQRHFYDVSQVDVFSGPSFYWAEAVCELLGHLGRPYVLTLHGGGLPDFAVRATLRVKRLLNSAAAVTVPSRYLLNRMSAYRKDLILLPNAVDLSAYGGGKRKPGTQLVWLRAFHDIYNPSMAVRVLARLKDDFPSVKLTMIGPNKEDGSWERNIAAAKEYGVEAHLEMRGPVPKNLVPRIFDSADIFLNTSNIDNTPVSLLEAMAAGTSIVSTDAGGIPDLLESGREALLVPIGDDAAMADAVRRLLLDRAFAERLQLASREKVRSFDWSVVLPQWQNLLLSVSQGSLAHSRAVPIAGSA